MKDFFRYLTIFLMGAIFMGFFLHFISSRRRALLRKRQRESLAHLTPKERSRARIGALIDKQIAESVTKTDELPVVPDMT